MNETLKRSFAELQQVDQVVAQLYNKDPELKKTKFGYAYDQFHKKNYASILEEFQQAMALARLDNALEDEKTHEVLVDQINPRGYKFSKDGLKKCIDKELSIIEEFNKKEVEIEPYISSFVPTDLSDSQREILTGLVI